MKALQKLTSCLAFCLVAVGLASNMYAHEAKAVKVVGTVEVQLPGQSAATPVTLNMGIPQGAIITTARGGQLFLETAPGVVATIQSESTLVVEKLAIEKQGDTITSQEAILDLKKGSVVSTLDPTKKAINHYGVRTPKGVAAARGTVYGVSVTIQGTSVATLSGTVTLNLGNGVSVSIPVGSGVVNNAETVSTLAAAIAASGQEGLTVAQLLQEAVQVVADNVAANTSAAGGSDTATAVLAAVVSAAATAQPDQAANFTQAAVTAISSSTSSTGGSAASINAVTEAAVRAAPAQATEIARSASSAVTETKVTEAVNAAKASGGDTAAAAAAAQSEAAAVNSTVAQTVVNAAAATGTTVTAESVAAAVNTGSTEGTAAAGTNTGTTVAPPTEVPPPAAPAPTETAPITTPQTPVDLPPVSAAAPPPTG